MDRDGKPNYMAGPSVEKGQSPGETASSETLKTVDAPSPQLTTTPEPPTTAKQPMKRLVAAADRILRVKRRRRDETNFINVVNAKSDEDFIRDHLQPSPGWSIWEHPKDHSKYTLTLQQAGALSEADFDACFNLIEKTSGDDYRASAAGWQPKQKKAEMRSPELRYVLVKNSTGHLRGFVSLMPCFEDVRPVVYCYEIHLEDELHGTGLARELLEMLDAVARNTPPIEAVMLTCYTSNTRAQRFYTKLGFTTDHTSPCERKLRGGKVKLPEYAILHRAVNRDTSGEGGGDDPK